MTWKPILTLIALFSLAACGGRVQFVPKESPGTLPPPPDPSREVTESFRFGQTSGTQVIVFVVYPRKSLRQARDRVVQFLPSFMDAVWNGAEGYQDMHFAVLRDVALPKVQWYSPEQSRVPRSQWRDESQRFLQSQLSALEIEHSDTDSDSPSPFAHFKSIGHAAAARVPVSKGPLWISYYYLRDGDIPSDQTDAASSAADSFRSSLKVAPASAHRVNLNLISYLSAGGECDPLPSRVSKILPGLFASFKHHAEELCHVSSDHSTHASEAMERLGAQANSQARRVILSQPPRLDTLQVFVNGVAIPREQIELVQEHNEVLFRQNATPSPVLGDEIQVKYEPTR